MLIPAAPCCPCAVTHHQKAVMVDGEPPQGANRRPTVAYVGGIDLCDGRYDWHEHSLFATTAPGGPHEKDFHQPCIPGGVQGSRVQGHHNDSLCDCVRECVFLCWAPKRARPCTVHHTSPEGAHGDASIWGVHTRWASGTWPPCQHGSPPQCTGPHDKEQPCNSGPVKCRLNALSAACSCVSTPPANPTCALSHNAPAVCP